MEFQKHQKHQGSLLKLVSETPNTVHINTKQAIPGFKNSGVLCYVNSFLQLLFCMDGSLELLCKIEAKTDVLKEFIKLAKVYKDAVSDTTSCAALDAPRYLDPSVFARYLIKSSVWLGGGQNDVSEAMLVLLENDFMDKEFRSIFVGKYKNGIMCMVCKEISKTTEEFTSIMLENSTEGISSTPTIGNLIGQHTSEEVLLPGEEYACEKCKQKSRAIKKLGEYIDFLY